MLWRGLRQMQSGRGLAVGRLVQFDDRIDPQLAHVRARRDEFARAFAAARGQPQRPPGIQKPGQTRHRPIEQRAIKCRQFVFGAGMSGLRKAAAKPGHRDG